MKHVHESFIDHYSFMDFSLSYRQGPFRRCPRLLVLHLVHVRMRHPGLRRPHFDVPVASIWTLHETLHSYIHIKDHATGQANCLEFIRHLPHFRLIVMVMSCVGWPFSLFVCYYVKVEIVSHSDGKYGCYGCQELNKAVGQAVTMCHHRICQKTRYLYWA